MQNDMPSLSPDPDPSGPAADLTARPDKTLAVTRGTSRLLQDMGYAVLPEVTLPVGRRADLMGINSKGRIVIIEIKSCREDFTCDRKWHAYLEFCDLFYFATDPDFPKGLLPAEEGRIVADAWGAAILREGPERPMAAARRKSLTLRFARNAAQKLAAVSPL